MASGRTTCCSACCMRTFAANLERDQQKWAPVLLITL
jgi:hypothetical protein